jgi:DNA repair protein RadC
MITKVQLMYKNKQNISERPQIKTIRQSFDIILPEYDPDTIELKEEFKVLLLNRANRVLGIVDIASGGVCGVTIDIKLIMRAAILSNASSIILSHNHPSMDTKRSPEDDAITRRVKNACEMFGIKLLDHLIITPYGYYSYVDDGIL